MIGFEKGFHCLVVEWPTRTGTAYGRRPDGVDELMSMSRGSAGGAYSE